MVALKGRVMAAADLNEFHDRYSESVTSTLAAIRPGEVTPPDVVAAAADYFCRASGLDGDQLLVNPFGYPVLPVPVGGRNKLPSNVTLDFAGHPVFWLEDKIARRDDETVDEWAIRLYMELLARGWWDPTTGEWFDVLAAAPNFDMEDPDVRARVARYRDGEPDADLANLVIPEEAPTLLDRNMPRSHAKEIVALLTPVLVDVTGWAENEVHRAAASARLFLDSEFDVMAQQAVQALAAFQKVAGSDGWQERWTSTSRAVHALMDQIDEMFHALLDAVGPVVMASARDESEYLEAVYAVAGQIQEGQDDRRREFGDLLMAIRTDGTNEASYRSLFGRLKEWHRSAIEDLERAFVEVDRIGPDGVWHAPKPDEGVDDGPVSIPGSKIEVLGPPPVAAGPKPAVLRSPRRSGPVSAGDAFALDDDIELP